MKVVQSIFDERPFQPIKGLFQVYLQNHVSLFPSHPVEVGNVFLNNNGIVRGSPFRDEAGLSKAYESGEKRFYAVDNDFCDQLISDIAQAYGYGVPNHGSILAFRN